LISFCDVSKQVGNPKSTHPPKITPQINPQITPQSSPQITTQDQITPPPPIYIQSLITLNVKEFEKSSFKKNYLQKLFEKISKMLHILL
jgi:hypothetical protein